MNTKKLCFISSFFSMYMYIYMITKCLFVIFMNKMCLTISIQVMIFVGCTYVHR